MRSISRNIQLFLFKMILTLVYSLSIVTDVKIDISEEEDGQKHMDDDEGTTGHLEDEGNETKSVDPLKLQAMQVNIFNW